MKANDFKTYLFSTTVIPGALVWVIQDGVCIRNLLEPFGWFAVNNNACRWDRSED